MNTATQQEQVLIDAIKARPGFQAWPGRLGGSVIIAQTTANGVKHQSVWLGRSRSIANLKLVLIK